MDLLDIIEEKRFLGQEFLTWLWFKSEERGGTIFLPEAGEDIQLVFEKHMMLEYGEGENREKLICRGLMTELAEARTGLAMGKKLEQARMLLTRGEYEWNLSFKATLMEFRNVKPPKTMGTAEEGGDPEAVEGRLLEHISLHEMAVRTMDQLFRMFLALRIGAEWEREVGRMRAWIGKAQETH
jgi:recombination associated protein RdgC